MDDRGCRTNVVVARFASSSIFEVVKLPSDCQPRMQVSENFVVEVQAEHDLAFTRSATRHGPIPSTESNNAVNYMGHRPYCWTGRLTAEYPQGSLLRSLAAPGQLKTMRRR